MKAQSTIVLLFLFLGFRLDVVKSENKLKKHTEKLSKDFYTSRM